MRRRVYVRPRVSPISMIMESPVMAGSVIDQDNKIKAVDQEVEEVDFSSSQFDLNWE